MLHPRKYHKDCMALIGDIIDYEPGYVSKKNDVNSGYIEKKKTLMSIEYKLPKHGVRHAYFLPEHSAAEIADHYLHTMFPQESSDYEGDCG